MNPKEQEQKPITNDLPAKIIMKNCPKFRAQILSDITKIPESKFIDTEFLDTHLPFTLAVNGQPNQGAALLPTVGKKIKLEVLN